MKVTVCDACYWTGKRKLTETMRYSTVKGRSDLKLELCDKHRAEFAAKAGNKVTPEYVQEAYRLKGRKITITEATNILKRGW